MRTRHRSRGVTLIVVLLILVIVSILGIAAVQISTLAERGARNDRDMQIALQTAEAALIDAEFDIYGPGPSPRRDFFRRDAPRTMEFLPGCGQSGNNRGLCQPTDAGAGTGQQPVWLAVDFTDDGASARSAAFGEFTGRKLQTGNGIQPAMLPRYVIEPLVDTAGDRDATKATRVVMYRVTAMGFGPRKDIQAVVQMVFRP